MTNNERDQLIQAQTIINNLLAGPQLSPAIKTEDELRVAIAKAQPFDTLLLHAGLVYGSPLTLEKPVILTSEVVGGLRMTRDEPAPQFVAGLRCTSDDVTLEGLEVRHTNPLTDIVVNSGARFTMDRCRVLGDPVTGGKRGIAANGDGAQVFTRCYVADIKGVGQDTQAICAWDCGAGIEILDCYLEAAGQSVMFGGADSLSELRIPRGVRITNSTLTKNPDWFGQGWQIKCALEFKSCIDAIVDTCVLEYGGTSQGQGAYLVVATPRNQGGKAPWSTVQVVDIKHCTGGHAAGILNVLGSDNNNPSGPVDGFVMDSCTFTDIDPKGVTLGAGRLFMFDRAAKNVALTNITVTGQNLAALGYFDGAAPTGLVLGGMVLPASKYGWKIDGGGSGRKALLAYAPDAQLDATII